MPGKYGCPWSHMICIQSCGCCKNCTNTCPTKCGVYLHNEGKPDISTEPSQKLHSI